MPHWSQVFIYEVRRGFRRKGFLFTTFVLPILLIAVGGLLIRANMPTADRAAQTTDQVAELVDEFMPDPNARYGVVDESGLLATTDFLPILIRYADETAAQAALNSSEIVGYYRIPADYLETGLVTLAQPRLNIGDISTMPIRAPLLLAISQAAAEQGLDPALLARLQNPATYQIINLSMRSAEAAGQVTADDIENANFVLVYVFAIVFLLSLFTTNGYLLQSVIEEKETRLIEILIASMQPFHLIAGKIAAYGVLGLIQIGAWIAIIAGATLAVGGDQLQQMGQLFVTLANMNIPVWVLGVALIYFVLGYLLFAGLYGIVGAISNSMREGPQYAVLFTLPAVAPIYFITLFVSQPDSGIPVFLSLFPLTAPIAMMQRILVSPVPAWQIGLSIVLLILAVVGSMWLAGRVFRVQTLLAGSPPKLRDLPKLVRG